MRPSVLLFCVVCLALFWLLAFDTQPKKARQQVPPAAIPVAGGIPKTEAETAPQNHGALTAIPDGAALAQQIMAALNSGDPGQQAMIFTNQLLALIKSDPWAAARLADADQLRDWRTELMRVVAQNWAKADPREAAKWVASLENPDERDTMLSCVCFSTSDPGQAIQILEQQGLNDRREVMLGNLAQQWASQNLPAARTWADGYPPGSLRDSLFQQIALAQSHSDPPQAAATVADNIPPGPAQNEAAFLVLDQWAQQDWEGAVAWANLFPAGELYDQGQTVLTRASQREQTKGTLELTIQQQ